MRRVLKLLLIGVMVLFPNVVHAETLDIGSEEVNTLMDGITIEENRFGNWFGYYYKNDKVTINDFSNQMKLYFAARTFNPNEGTNGVKVTVSKEQMSTAMKSIFGPDIKYNDETIKVDPTLLATGTYDTTKQEYTLDFDHAWGDEFSDGYPYYFSERISATKDDKKIEVNEKAMYYEMFSQSKTNDGFYIKTYRVSPKTLITKSDVGDEREYLKLFDDYMDTYKYTFKKASDGKYYFYSVENMKDAKEYKNSKVTVKKTNTKEKNPKTADSNILFISTVGIICLGIAIICSKKLLKK